MSVRIWIHFHTDTQHIMRTEVSESHNTIAWWQCWYVLIMLATLDCSRLRVHNLLIIRIFIALPVLCKHSNEWCVILQKSSRFSGSGQNFSRQLGFLIHCDKTYDRHLEILATYIYPRYAIYVRPRSIRHYSLPGTEILSLLITTTHNFASYSAFRRLSKRWKCNETVNLHWTQKFWFFTMWIPRKNGWLYSSNDCHVLVRF